MIKDVDSIIAMSNAEIIQSLGAQFRNYRITSNMTQQEVADKTGVSIITIRNFETGKSQNITLANLLALLRCVDRLEAINELLPPIPISPYQLSKLSTSQPQRVRHAK